MYKMYSTILSKSFETLMGCLWSQTMMLCASVQFFDQVYLLLYFFVGLVKDKC